MVDHHGRFVWYELMTTDMAAAKAFYCAGRGLGRQDARRPIWPTACSPLETAPVSGLMELPEEATENGRDAEVGGLCRRQRHRCCRRADQASWRSRLRAADRQQYRPHFDRRRSANGNICVGRGIEARPAAACRDERTGHVGWHELLAADWTKAFAFYGELFGWRKADAEIGPTDIYQLFSAGEQTIGGMFTKLPTCRYRSGFITSMSAISTRLRSV